MVLEVLMMTLEAVMSQCKESNQPCPDTLIVVSDNTVKEFKNSPCLTYLASLVNHGRLRFLGQAMNKGPGVFGVGSGMVWYSLFPTVVSFLLSPKQTLKGSPVG